MFSKENIIKQNFIVSTTGDGFYNETTGVAFYIFIFKVVIRFFFFLLQQYRMENVCTRMSTDLCCSLFGMNRVENTVRHFRFIVICIRRIRCKFQLNSIVFNQTFRIVFENTCKLKKRTSLISQSLYNVNTIVFYTKTLLYIYSNGSNCFVFYSHFQRK